MTQNALQGMFQGAPVAPTAPAGAPAPMYTPPSPDAMFGGHTDSGKDRFPRPNAADYSDLEVVASGMTFETPYFYIDFKVCSAGPGGSPVGSIIHFDQCLLPGKAVKAGVPKIRRALIAIMTPLGITDDAKLNAFSGPAGDAREIMAACAGMHVAGHGGKPYPANPLAGLHVAALVTLGNSVKTKDPVTGQLVDS